MTGKWENQTLEPSLCRYGAEPWLVVGYRYFGTACRFNLQGSWTTNAVWRPTTAKA